MNWFAGTNHTRKRLAFSLIELLVVMSIIVLLASLVAATATYARRKAKEGRTKVQLRAIESALVQHESENHYYPQQPAGVLKVSTMNALVDSRGRKYLDLTAEIFSETTGANIIDAFGNPFYFASPGTMNAKSFDLWSMGLDGKHGDGGSSISAAQTTDNINDDITNWKRES